MIEVLNLDAIKEFSDDRNELSLLLRQLLGQPFLCFRISYGDELTVHLGESREYSHPKMKHRRKGSYILSARASAWYLRPDSQPIMFAGSSEMTVDANSVSEKLDVREIETRQLVTAGSVVARVEVLPSPEGFGLALAFTDRSTLNILPASSPPSMDANDDGSDEVADWELFTPYHRYMRVGPGLRWSYLADDQPTSK